jgi:hypothetical protein
MTKVRRAEKYGAWRRAHSAMLLAETAECASLFRPTCNSK